MENLGEKPYGSAPDNVQTTGSPTLPVAQDETGEANTKDSHWETLPQGIVKSAGRVMQILEFFDDFQKEANITDVSNALCYPQSSTSELMRSLHKLGYLQYDPRNRTFVPTSRVRLLGSWINTGLHGTDRLSRIVTELNDEFGHAAYLAARNEMCAQYIHVIQATTSLRLHLTPGQKRPLVRSAAGLVLLSDLDDAEISKIVRRDNAERRKGSDLVDVKDVLASTAQIRIDHFIHVPESRISPGAAVIAMALPRELFNPPLVMGVGGAAKNLNPSADEIIGFMKELVVRHLRDSQGGSHDARA